MKIKVCGMRDIENISDVLTVEPNFMGFIFYPKSPRFTSNIPQTQFPAKTKKVGVFVNEEIEKIFEKVERFQLDFVQLHGSESPEYCSELFNSNLFSKNNQVHIIKAFSVNENFNFNATTPYEVYCKYFLFDTKGTNFGGNGVKFNWEILKNYKGNTPFLLSGGITKNDVEAINKINHPKFKGVDINSGFEIKPGLKNVKEIREFKNNLK